VGLLFDVEDLQNDLVAAIGVGFGLGSSWAIVDFSEAKSSSDVDGWGEFSLFPLPYGRISPVDSDGLWCPLVLGTEPGRMAFRALALRRRNAHRATAAIRTRIATAATTTPAIAPLFTDEAPTTGVSDVADGLLVEGVVAGEGGVERVGEGMEEGATGRVAEGGMEDCDWATRHETSTPLFTAKMFDDRTPVGV